MNAPNPISLVGLHAGYDGNTVVGDVDLEVAAGERVVLLGPNGAGKTTLFRCLLGLVAPMRGEARLFGQIPSDPRTRRRLLARVGTSLESPGLPAQTHPLEYLEHFARLSGLRDPRELARRSLRHWELPEHTDAQRMSQGQRQRLQVARSLIHSPQLALLDEPAANLDPSAQDDFWQMLDQWQAATGSTLVVSTHHLEEAFRHAPRWVLLGQGRLLADGAPQQILSSVRGSRRLRLAEPVQGTRLAGVLAGLDIPVDLRGELERTASEWRLSSSNEPAHQARILRALVDAGMAVVGFGEDGVSMQESYRLLLGGGTGSDTTRLPPYEIPAVASQGLPGFLGTVLAAARLHGAGLSRERRMVLPILFMVAMLIASALWAIPGGLSSPEILLPLLGLASLLPAGLAGGIAADLIAGERERRSLETLLCAPASPFALVVGKSLSIFVPAVAMSWLAIGLVWWALASRSMAPSLPSTLGVALGFAPMATIFSLSIGTWMSARSRTVRAAAQMSALTTVPLIALSQAIPLLTPSDLPPVLAWCVAGAFLGGCASGIYLLLRRRLKPHRLLR